MAIPQTFDEAFARVKELVAIFKENESFYTSSGYNEADARKDFIDKFWIALGWDVNHEQQTDPYKQEVKVERGVATSEFRKRADYAFLSPNFRDVRFFVEAKKPHAGIDTPLFCFQTIRYGWNSHVPISVLHDFEEMRVLDCRYKPDINTSLGHAVLKYHYSDYLNEQSFRTIYYLFSREKVIEGSIQEYAKGLPKISRKRAARGVATDEHQSIDESFLQELDDFREELARAYKRKNPELDGPALTEVTQRTLDRLVFMRFLEDKLIESDSLIEDLHKKGKSWENFIATSRRLDRVYNGIIFKEHSLLDSNKFNADERVFDKISQSLSHRESPYDFNAIPIHILGSIYERFLGKVIVATAKQARVEDKPEVRKAGGVYYTPEYIVRYIVENTVGKLIEGKTPAQIQEMRFADIACGSGSFLLGVYDTLLRYHTAYYSRTKKNRDIGIKAGCIPKTDGTLQLSLLQKRQVLINNIYGVDIDPQAVEVAQLSLYLKLLEDETIASAKSQQRALHAALLPSLSKNIVCGNSLIGWDILEGKLFDSGEERKLNPMNFEDAFPEVMKRGGFDAIVGNPPYGAEIGVKSDAYLRRRFLAASYQLDTYPLFIEAAFRLLRPNGSCGMIIPTAWVASKFNESLRRLLSLETRLESVVIAPKQAFKQATVETLILVFAKEKSRDNVVRVERWDIGAQLAYSIPQSHLSESAHFIFSVYSAPANRQIVERIKKDSEPLSNYADAVWGVKIYQRGKGKPHQDGSESNTRSFHSAARTKDTHKPLLGGRAIQRYSLEWEGEFVDYGEWLAEPRSPEWFVGTRILVREVTANGNIQATLVEGDFVFSNSIDGIRLKNNRYSILYILGVLNSKLISFFHSNTSANAFKDAFPKVLIKDLLNLPLPKNELSTADERARHDRMVQLVDQMLEAKKQLASARTERDKTFYENKCATLDRQIDSLVYELYGLTEAEIAIVEEGSK
jgi:adenine-specific DNA-methyltransferase